MDKVISKVKSVRYNVWEDFKKFMRIPGYKYYEMPKELKFRYPAPGSVPRDQKNRPSLYKHDYKTAFIDSEYDIRRKPVKLDSRFGEEHTIHHQGISKRELDPENPIHANVLKGPIRNRRLIEDEAVYVDDEIFGPNMDMDEYRRKVRKGLEDWQEEKLQIDEDLHGANLTEIDDLYRPNFLWFYERGADGCGDDPNVKFTYLSIEHYIEDVLGKERIETKQMDMYKGTVKKWQVLDDEQFSGDQVDRVQNSIKAPVKDELDRYEEQNNVKMTLPINNQNVSEWRDKRRAIDNADFNSKLIEFEKKRHQNYFMKRYERPKSLE